MTLHQNEVRVDESAVRSLLLEQRPDWARLPLARAGAGTENTMYRLGDDLLLRLPRTPSAAGDLAKERPWLPRLAPRLPFRVPEPVHEGGPGAAYPLPWAAYRWIEGAEPGPGSVDDWPAFGTDLAAFVGALHAVPLLGAVRAGGLSWYRGGSLRDCAEWVGKAFDGCAALDGLDLDTGKLRALWESALALPEPSGRQVWLHGDLKPTNLLVREGRLHAVIDFGSLSVGHPDAEHAAVWDLPAPAREAYWAALDLDGQTWLRARAWAIAVGVSGVEYYWHSYPAFVAECLARLRAILAAA
ncbi:aminoglycoside phosphotransferase family protein [Kitasatospora sp. NPDC006697]|uniref:aminoglycoside phosphotransferase family protein n=1 Tax=Kitasatospora sp. NPDC006697 TaxID=3364020 RepID=UPI0036751038